MTKNFDAFFRELSMRIDEDIKKDIYDRETLSGYKSDRDEEGYEDLITPFKTDTTPPPKVASRWKQPAAPVEPKSKEKIPDQAFKEISFRLSGIDIKKYGSGNILKAATAKYGPEAQSETPESEIGVNDADGLEEAFLKTVKGDSTAISKVENGTFRLIIPTESYAANDYPPSFMYGDIKMNLFKIVKHKETDNVIVAYAPSGMTESTSKKAYDLLVKMLADTIIQSPYYAKLSDPAVFASTYGIEPVSMFPDAPLLDAGVGPEPAKILRYVIRFSLANKFKSIEVSIPMKEFGFVNIEVLLRSDSKDATLTADMNSVGEEISTLLNSVFAGTTTGRFFTVDRRLKNFSDQVLKRMSAKEGYKEKQKARLAAQKLEGQAEEGEEQPVTQEPESLEPKI